MSNEANTRGENEQLQPSVHLGGPFHPAAVQTPQGEMQYYGASMRDYLASNAPSEVPDWFTCTGLLELPELPALPTNLQALKASPGFDAISDDKDAVETAYACLANGFQTADQRIIDIVSFAHDMLKASRDAHQAAEKQRIQVRNENAALRYFAWRWHYADQMLKARGY